MACPDKRKDEAIIKVVARRKSAAKQEQVMEWSGTLMDFYQFGKDEDISSIWKTDTGYAVAIKQ